MAKRDIDRDKLRIYIKTTTTKTLLRTHKLTATTLTSAVSKATQN